jgi:phenylpropionate dioxygenase-like ring-hydroxylating dioxygenase large terminal subunit
VNYTRAIENQLDVSNLPFVHRTTIGRGNRTLVNGPIVELEGDVLNVWVSNEVDMGQIPKK